MTVDRYVSSTGRRRRSARTERRGVRTGLFPWSEFVSGAVFLAVGLFLVLIGNRIIPAERDSANAPWWVLTLCGTVFALAGLALWGTASRHIRYERRRRDAARQRPDEPAFQDYGWDTRGFAAPRWSRAARTMGLAIGMTLFFSVFNYWAFATKSPWMVKLFTAVFDLILLGVWWGALIVLGRTFKFSGSRIEFARFPYLLQQPVIIRWHPATGIARARQGTFTLYCVEEWTEIRGHGKQRSSHLVQEELWSGTWHLDQPKLFARGEIVELLYELPKDVPPTRLSAPKPIFWEFEVKLDLPGLDFKETYLIPIYDIDREIFPKS